MKPNAPHWSNAFEKKWGLLCELSLSFAALEDNGTVLFVCSPVFHVHSVWGQQWIEQEIPLHSPSCITDQCWNEPRESLSAAISSSGPCAIGESIDTIRRTWFTVAVWWFDDPPPLQNVQSISQDIFERQVMKSKGRELDKERVGNENTDSNKWVEEHNECRCLQTGAVHDSIKQLKSYHALWCAWKCWASPAILDQDNVEEEL